MIQERTIIALDTAATDKPLMISGSAVAVLRASSGGALIQLAAQDNPSVRTPLFRGLGVEDRPFQRLMGTWDAQPGEWVELIAWGDPRSPVVAPKLIVLPALATNDSNQPIPAARVNIDENWTVLTTVFPARGVAVGTVDVQNVGADAVKAFRVMRQAYPGAPWRTYAEEEAGSLTPGDFTSGVNPGIQSASNPGVWELTGGQSGDFDMNGFVAYAIRFEARCDVGDATTLAIGGNLCKG